MFVMESLVSSHVFSAIFTTRLQFVHAHVSRNVLLLFKYGKIYV